MKPDPEHRNPGPPSVRGCVWDLMQFVALMILVLWLIKTIELND